MLLRIVRGRVLAGREKDFIALSRQRAADGARLPGLLAFMVGYRRVERTDDFISVSSWVDEESIVSAVGPQPIARPTSAEMLADIATIDTVEHYTLLLPVHRGILDAPGALLRVVEATVNPGRLRDLLEWLREKDRELNVMRSVLGWSMGHKVEGDRDVLYSATAWASPLQVEQMAEAGRAGKTMFAKLDELVTDVRIDQYQAIELKLPEELADAGGLRIIAARFASDAAATTAQGALEEAFPSAREAGIFLARLGGTSGAEEQRLLVARMTLADHFGAERLIADLGGQVLYEADEVADETAPPMRGLQQPAQGI